MSDSELPAIHPPSGWARALAASGALLTALFTALATGFAFRSQHLAEENDLDRFGAERAFSLRERMELCGRALLGVDQYYLASEEVRRDELEHFTAGILPDFPEIDSLAWVPGSAASWGVPGAVHLLHGAGADDEIEGRNVESLIGWSKAIDQSRASNSPVLVQPGNSSEGETGHRWLLLPVGGEQRGGVLAARLDLLVLMQKSLERLAQGGAACDLLLLEGAVPVAACSWRTKPQGENRTRAEGVLGRPHHSEMFRAWGNAWTLACAPGPASLNAGVGWIPWGVLIGGSLGTAALLWLHVLATHQARLLRSANESMWREIRLRRQSEAAQMAAAEKARAANEAKSRFLARMSHELRTPLNGVLGMSRELQETALDDDQRATLDTIQSSGELLLGMVGDVLDFTRLEAGRLRIRDEPMDVRGAVERAVQLHAEQATTKGLGLTCTIDSAVPVRVRGDSMRWKQVVLNLLSNAVKFTEEGTVDVHVTREDDGEAHARLRVVVEDSGPGIPAGSGADLFESFALVDDSMARRHGGMGLGLSISKEIVELMGGEIGIENRDQGGCVAWFTVRLEILEESGSQRPAVEVRGSANPASTESRVPARGRQSESPMALPDLHVLLVDDNVVNQRVARRVLERAGCVVHVVANGQEAIDAVETARFDLVLMDCQMPVMDGYEATARIRASETGRDHMPIVALTAHALPEERARCRAAGMDEFVSKPFRPEDLIATIQGVLGLREMAA